MQEEKENIFWYENLETWLPKRCLPQISKNASCDQSFIQLDLEHTAPPLAPPSVIFSPKYPQWPRLGQANAGSWEATPT